MRINHPTKAEEAARPEGDVRNWGAVLAKDAYWLDDHKQGPGLYSEVKPFSDHVQTIHEKGPYAAVSIAANGSAVMEAGKPVMKEGVPLLKSLHAAEGVDMVTRAGAGGMFLSESAAGPNKGELEMDEAQVKALIESGIKAGLAAHKDGALVGLLERARKGDVTVLATRMLSSVTLAEASKQRVIENVLRGSIPLTEAGEVDEPKLIELVNAEAKREGSYVAQLTGSGRVLGMGSAPVAVDEAEVKRQEAARTAEQADAVDVFKRFGLTEAQAKAAAGREAA